MQVEYSFYVNIYGGTKISETDWKRLSQRSLQRLRQFTHGRLPEDWSGESWKNQVSCAVCEMAEILSASEERDGKTSENTDGYSVSYDTGKSVGGQLYDVARAYLSGTGLLYLGVRCGHAYECGNNYF